MILFFLKYEINTVNFIGSYALTPRDIVAESVIIFYVIICKTYLNELVSFFGLVDMNKIM